MKKFVISSRLFSYGKEEDLFVAEESVLGNYNRAYFFIRSERTGTAREFVLARSDKDADGDVVAWHYIGYDHNHRAVVFND